MWTLVGKIKNIEKSLDDIRVNEFNGKQFESGYVIVDVKYNDKGWTTSRVFNISKQNHIDLLRELKNDDYVNIVASLKPYKDKRTGDYKDSWNVEFMNHIIMGPQGKRVATSESVGDENIVPEVDDQEAILWD